MEKIGRPAGRPLNWFVYSRTFPSSSFMLVELSFCTNFSSTMASVLQFVCLFTLILMIKPMFSRQSYDNSNCNSEPQVPGSNYICSPEKDPCKTFIVYRAQPNYQTLSSIASLFNADISKLFSINNMVEANSSKNLMPGHEIIIPITCCCPDRFSEAKFIYNSSHSDSLPTAACTVFEGLVKAQSLMEENPDFGGDYPGDLTVTVPVRCACLGKFERDNGVKYLVTYPVIEGDRTDLMALKFGVHEEMILAVNKLHRYAAIFPQTTLLIPTKNVPMVNREIDSVYENSSPSPQESDPLKKVKNGTKPSNKISHLLLGLGIFTGIVVMVVVSAGSIFFWKRYHRRRFEPLSARASQLSNLSQDFLDGMSKLKQSLMGFSLEELRNATEDFGKAAMIGGAVYQGRIGGRVMAIKEMETEEAAHHVIEILTRINHVNMVKLEGCCYAPRPYLVFEFVENGSLRDCLSDPKVAMQLTWKKRKQIAFDIAVGLHYIHYCTKPTYVHRNIHSRNVLITRDWRAKISGFRMAKALLSGQEEIETQINEYVVVGKEGHLAPEYLSNGLVSRKMDIYAFGVVLLELVSAKEAITKESFFLDSAKLVMEGSSERLEKLKEFMDPFPQGDYQLSDVLCLASLANHCTEDDPRLRPTINDLLKALSSII